MSAARKPKDHLFDLDDVARSVLLGHTITSVCGEKRVLTREDLGAEYHGTCKRCMAGAHADAARDDTPFQINPKNGWLRIIERAWLARYEEQETHRTTLPTWSFKWTVSPHPVSTTEAKETES